MNRFSRIFHNKCNIIGMIHLDALPGTPKYRKNFRVIIEKAKHEANIYRKHNLDAVLIENMHDVPYVQDRFLGPETVACMARISAEIKKILEHTPCGIQILACGNKEALAVAKACDLQFIRAESFVFGHVADEGYTNACAGQLLRYRQQIDAFNILVFTDIKKKHSSHSITADTNILETAKAAEFFLTDGVVLTGTSTGDAANIDDLTSLQGKLKTPILIGSGVTTENIDNYYQHANAVIIGSHFKKDGYWENELCEERILKFVNKLENLRHQ